MCSHKNFQTREKAREGKNFSKENEENKNQIIQINQLTNRITDFFTK